MEKLYKEDCVALWGEDFTEKAEALALETMQKTPALYSSYSIPSAELVLASAISLILKGVKGDKS